MTAVKAIRVEGIEAIERRVEPWRDLAHLRGRNRPFSGPGFVLAALKAYHRDAAPILHAVESNGQWEAALPLIERPLQKAGLTINEFGFPRNPNVLVNDPLLPDDGASARDILGTLLKAIASERCDTLILDHMPRDTNAPELMVAVGEGLGYSSDGVEDSRDLCFVSIEGSFDDYLSTRSSDHRWQLKKILRKAGQAGATVECLRTRSEITAAMPQWFDIERNSWQGSTKGAAMTDEDREFMRHLLTDLDDSEVGELWLLHIADEPAAALRMLADGERICVHTMHYDQRFKHLTPGAILLEAMLRSAWERGLSEVDLHGSSAFFKRWATGERPHQSVRLYKPGLYGSLLRESRRLSRRFEAWQAARRPEQVA
jgi:CelD/BcsL family acetyltransferase involved in cellulose biosynthesis